MIANRVVFCAAFGLAAAFAFGQATLNVPGQYSTIQAAIQAAASGDTVLVAPGTYPESIDFLGKAITVRSSMGREVTTIGPHAMGGRLVQFSLNETRSSVLRGFTLLGAQGVYGSTNGVLAIYNASPTIMDCTIAQGYAVGQPGGGIRIESNGAGTASPMISQCRIVSNFSSWAGGGISIGYYGGSCSPVITECEIKGNSAGDPFNPPSTIPQHGGGGICVFMGVAPPSFGTPTFEDCLIADNSATLCGPAGSVFGYGGGGVFLGFPSSMKRCHVVNNRVWDVGPYPGLGGGVYVWTAASINSCVIAGNTANLGAGLANAGLAEIAHCTIADNVGSIGSGVWGAVGDITLVNSIVWGNTGVPVAFGSAFPSAVTVLNNDIQGGWYGGGNISADPIFLDEAAGDYHLASISPCIGGGVASVSNPSPTDLDGTPRIQGPTADMGADEVPLPVFPGSNEDLDFYAWVNEHGDPLASSKTAIAGDLLSVRFISPGGGLTGEIPLLFGILYATGGSAGTTPGLPTVQMDVASALLMFGSLGGAFQVPPLPPHGIDLAYAVPPGIAGNTIRMQAFALSPIASNGVFAATAAQDVVFQ